MLTCTNLLILPDSLAASSIVWVPMTLAWVNWRESPKELSTWLCAAKCITVSILYRAITSVTCTVHGDGRARGAGEGKGRTGEQGAGGVEGRKTKAGEAGDGRRRAEWTVYDRGMASVCGPDPGPAARTHQGKVADRALDEREPWRIGDLSKVLDAGWVV